MIGRSAVMQEVFDLIRRLAPHVRTALIFGETGTGKELVARALHLRSAEGKRFVAVNCSAVVETLFESRALRPRTRRVHRRDRPQGRPLRDGRRRHAVPRRDRRAAARAAGQAACACCETAKSSASARCRPCTTDVRVVAATQPRPRCGGRVAVFRGPLYRLNVVQIALPPLRDRREDIPYLTARLSSRVRPALRKAHLRPGAAERCAARRRVHGLATSASCATVLERACILADGPVITEQAIAASFVLHRRTRRPLVFTDEKDG